MTRRKLDDVLASWPAHTPDPEDAAERVLGALGRPSKPGAASDEALLRAPLPAEPGESSRLSSPQLVAPPVGERVESKMSKSSDRRSRGSFSDLAKLATGAPPAPTPTPPPAAGVQRGAEAGGDDSGIVDFKMIAGLDPLAEQRAKETPLADQGLFDEDEKKGEEKAASAPASGPKAAAAAAPPSSGKSAAPSSGKSVATESKSAAPRAAAATAAPAEKKEKSSGAGGTVAMLLGGVVLIGAVAAGAVLYVRSHQLSFGDRPQAAAPAKTGAPAAASAATDTDTAVAQNDVPQADTPAAAPTTVAKGPKPVVAAGGGGKAGGKPEPTVDPKLTVKDLPQSGGGGGTDLGSAMRNVVGPVDTAPTPAAGGGGGGGPAGNVPQKPSQGMVQGAVNAVLPGARSCLGPDDPVSKATVVFKSDGSVQSVGVTGSASGKPAEQCIKNALGKAKVQPFAEATFTFPVTVRPGG